jgi:hypothetical protein
MRVTVGLALGDGVGSTLGQPVIGTLTVAVLLSWFASGSLVALTCAVLRTRGQVAIGAVTEKVTVTVAPGAIVLKEQRRLFGSLAEIFHAQLPADAGVQLRVAKLMSTSGSTLLSMSRTPVAEIVPLLWTVIEYVYEPPTATLAGEADFAIVMSAPGAPAAEASATDRTRMPSAATNEPIAIDDRSRARG